jgi:surface polysaccharide O-acyltransferase-like enzyme
MNRIQSTDVFRLIAITGVIAIHSTLFKEDFPRDDNIYKYLYLAVDQIGRSAVTFFFIVSGYFWGQKVRIGSSPLSSANKTAKRIAIIFLGWCCIYVFPFNIADFSQYGVLGPIKISYWSLAYLAHHPFQFLFQGTRYHLWFLVALIWAVYLSAFFIHKKWTKSLIFFAAIFFVFGVLANAYATTPIGIHVGFNTRNGPFYGFLPFALGYLISGKDISPKWLRNGALLFLLGVALTYCEGYIVRNHFGGPQTLEYVFGTLLMGLGAAIASLSNNKCLCIKSLSNMGKYTLGIYAVHVVFIDLFEKADKLLDNPIWEVGYVILVLLLSYLTVMGLAKNRFTKQIVL